jgi:NAD(P)H-nitrite reductase large subunit
MGVSGCPNQCAETCIKDIGLVGTRKGWRILVGGNGGTKARLSEELIADLTEQEALDTIDRIMAFYQANAKSRERLGKMIDRLGLDALRAAALPAAGAAGDRTGGTTEG